MSTLNEVKYAALLTLTGLSAPVTINELEIAWLEGLGYTTGTLNEKWLHMFDAEGFTTGTFNERMLGFLDGEGFSVGTLDEREYLYWLAGGGSGPWTPDDIPSLQTWLDGRNATTVADTWVDLSSRGIDWVKRTGKSFPTYTTSTGGAFRFNTALVEGPSYAHMDATGGEIFIKYRTLGSNSYNGLWSFQAAINDGPGFQPASNTTWYNSWGSDKRRSASNLGSYNLNAFHTLNIRSFANEWVSRLDGNVLYNDASNTVEFPNDGGSTTVYIGEAWGFINAMRADVAGVWIFNAKLSPADRVLMDAYCADY